MGRLFSICSLNWHSKYRSAKFEWEVRHVRSNRKKIKPLSDRVLVKALEKEEQKKGGIIIPDTAKEKPQEGEVIAAGPGKRDEQGKVIPMDVKTGDRILYGKYSGTELKLNDEEFLIMHQEDILGIIQ